MGIERWYTNTFYVQPMASGSSFPYDQTATTCTAFLGALDQIGSREQWADADLAAISSHWIACKTSVTIVPENRIRYGTRYFDVTGIVDPSHLRPNHHKEVYLKEVG